MKKSIVSMSKSDIRKVSGHAVTALVTATIFILFSCSSKGPDSKQQAAIADSCSIAKKFESAEMKQKKGKPDFTGEVKYFWDKDSTIVKSKHVYQHGELVKSSYFSEYGLPRFEYQFRCGALYGEQKTYHESGKLENLLMYSYGYRTGPGVFYNDNGVVTMRVMYSRDSVIGKPVFYGDDGKILTEKKTENR